MKYTAIVASILIVALPAPAGAEWVGSYHKTKPDAEVQTGLKLYDLERCMVEIDGPSVPVTYRQPDRPNTLMIAWPGGDLGGVSVVRLEGLEDAMLQFWGRDKVMRRIREGCLSK